MNGQRSYGLGAFHQVEAKSSRLCVGGERDVRVSFPLDSLLLCEVN